MSLCPGEPHWTIAIRSSRLLSSESHWRGLQRLPRQLLVDRTARGYFRFRGSGFFAEGWFGISNWVLVAATSLVAIANTLGLAGSDAFSLYIANLLLGLGDSGLAFLSVAKGVLSVERA